MWKRKRSIGQNRQLRNVDICNDCSRYVKQCRLNAWARWAVARGPNSIGGHAYLCMLCTACFLIFKHYFCWKRQYNRYMFNFIDHLDFYSCEWLCR